MHDKILALVFVMLVFLGGAFALGSASEQVTHNRTAEFDAVVSTVYDLGDILPYIIIGGAMLSAIVIWRRVAP